MTDRKVLIAGGGLGGMTAALCLARRGFEVDVFEQAPAIAEMGAGIQLSPNCTRVLHQLGLADALHAVCSVPNGVEIRHWRDGNVIAALPLGAFVRRKFGYPYYHAHRADLMDILKNAAGGHRNIVVRAGARVDAIQQQRDGVVVEAAREHHRGDVLVGADGIHSLVRESLFGPDASRFTGNIAWRALIPTQALPEGLVRPVATVWWGPGKHFVHYYVRGGELVNCVCVVEKEGWEEESWTIQGELAELKNDFHDWHETVTTLIDNIAPESCFKWALFDRDPMQHWSRDNVTLLGDACHATLPFLAQGAAMAIEDAAVLADCLAVEEDNVAALVRYESLRKERTARVQRASRRNARVFHMSGLLARLRNKVAQAFGDGITEWVYGYDAFDAIKESG